MKKIIILFSFIFLHLSLLAQLSGSGTFASPYSGTFQGDLQWNIGNFGSGKVYIGGDVTIDNEQLVIGSGMKIVFVAAGTDLIVNGTGRIDALGTSGSGMIRFTADYNDNSSYGESGERWGHIVFDNPSGSNQSTLDYCIIEYGDVSSGSNTTSYGGGIYSNIYSNLLLNNCTIRYNKATHGGGLLALSGSSPTFTNCLFTENTATTGGGGIYLHTNCTSTITNSIIYYNTSPGTGGGGGIFLHGCSNVRAINSNFVNNSTSRSDGGHDIQYYQITDPTNRPKFINCIAWGNDNSIAHLSCSPGSSDFVNCAIRDISTPASNYSNCVDLSSSNDLGGPNFIDPVLSGGVDWSIKVISPCRDAGTDSYSGVTIPTNDIVGTSKLNTKDIGAYEVLYNRWKLSPSSTDWSSGINWDQGVPSSSQNIVIPYGASNYPSVSTTIDYTIGAGYGMVLEPGAKVTLDQLTTTGDLKLMSSASGISSLITTNSVTAIIELFLAGGGSPNYKWHYISSPVSALPVSTFSPSPTLNLAQYFEARPTTTPQQGWVAFDGYVYYTGGTLPGLPYDIRGTNLTVGQGYNFYHSADYKFTFSGSTTVSTVSPTITYGGDPVLHGFNLLGNPYTSGLNWTTIINDVGYPANTSKGLYFTRNNSQCSFIADVGYPDATVTGIIPPMQGFFIRTTSTSTTLPLLAGARDHTIPARYKGEEMVIPLVRLQLDTDSTKDNTVIRFDIKAESTFDNDFDAVRMFLDESVQYIYSTDGLAKYAINGLPYPDLAVDVPLIVNLITNGSHTLNATQLQGLDNYYVDLIDNITGYSVRLNSNPVLTFASDAGLLTNRFVVRFSNISTSAEEPRVNNSVFNIYHKSGSLNIQTISDEWNGKTGTVNVYDLAGRTFDNLSAAEFSKNSELQLAAPKVKGLYLVEIRSGLSRYVGKVIIK